MTRRAASPRGAVPRATVRYDAFIRHVLPEFLQLLAERTVRSRANVDGRAIKALLDSATATAGLVATAPGTAGGHETWADAWALQSRLYSHLLAARRARFGPTPNRVPHGGYAPDEVWMTAETLLAADAGGGPTGREDRGAATSP